MYIIRTVHKCLKSRFQAQEKKERKAPLFLEKFQLIIAPQQTQLTALASFIDSKAHILHSPVVSGAHGLTYYSRTETHFAM